MVKYSLERFKGHSELYVTQHVMDRHVAAMNCLLETGN